jgi:hypothetical protein
MKRILVLLFIVLLASTNSNAQLTVSKLLGKDASKYGLGYGVFMFYDFPLSTDNKSIRLELMDLAFFPSKGENIFTSYKDSKAYLSIKLGYKYIFSETKTGFYILPSVGYCKNVFTKEIDDKVISGGGIAGAMEGGYGFEVGERGNAFNLGVKYEYDHTKSSELTMQSVGFRVSYSFSLFRRHNE